MHLIKNYPNHVDFNVISRKSFINPKTNFFKIIFQLFLLLEKKRLFLHFYAEI